MIPQSITVCNFQSYEGEYTLDFNFKQAIICGANGSGKSSIIIDPILFALFGTTRSDREDVINDNYDNCYVKYIFMKNEVYTVIRTLKRANASNMTLTVFQDGKDISERRLTDTQELLSSILGFNESLLSTTSISSQDDIHALVNLPPAGKEKILASLVNFDEWYLKREYVNNWLKTNGDYETKIKQEENRCLELNSSLTKTEENISLLKKDIIDKTGLKEKYESDISKLKNILEANQNTLLEINNLRLKLAEIGGFIKQIDIDSCGSNDLSVLIETRKRYQQYCADDTVTLNTTEVLKNEYHMYHEDMASRYRDLSTLKAQVTSCSTLDNVPCKETIFYNQCDLLKQARDTKKLIVEILGTDDISVVPEYFNTMREQLEHVKRNYQFICDKYHKIFNTVETHKSVIAKIDHKINQTKRMQVYQENYERQENILKAKQQTLTIDDSELASLELKQEQVYILRHQIENTEISLDTVNFNQKILTKQLEESIENVYRLKQTTNEYNLYKILADVYKDIPAVLLNDIIPRIEEYSNELLKTIFPGHILWIQTHRDTKSDTLVKSIDIWCITGTKKRKFKSLSGSEKFRFSLAFRIALSRLNSELYNIPLKFFVIDEGFGSLDDANINVVKNTLKLVANQFDLFLVITHVEDLKDTFNTQIIINPTGVDPKISINKIQSHYEVNIDD